MGCNCKKKSTVQQPKIVVKATKPKDGKSVEQSRANVAMRNRRIIRRVAR